MYYEDVSNQPHDFPGETNPLNWTNTIFIADTTASNYQIASTIVHEVAHAMQVGIMTNHQNEVDAYTLQSEFDIEQYYSDEDKL